MIYIEIMGGLGNQLFQIFCGIAYSLEIANAAYHALYMNIEYIVYTLNTVTTMTVHMVHATFLQHSKRI